MRGCRADGSKGGNRDADSAHKLIKDALATELAEEAMLSQSHKALLTAQSQSRQFEERLQLELARAQEQSRAIVDQHIKVDNDVAIAQQALHDASLQQLPGWMKKKHERPTNLSSHSFGLNAL